MQRNADTGLLDLQTPEERAALSAVFSMPGWAIVDAAIQMAELTLGDRLKEVSFPEVTSVEAGRRVGELQGRLKAFSEVLDHLREQLEPEPLPSDLGKDTVEGDSLGIPVPPQHEGGIEDGSEW